MNYAVIDIGSNTVKCEIFSYSKNTLRSIDFLSEQLGLIARINSGLLSAEDGYLLCDTINRFIASSKKYEAKIYCFATESLRKVKNLEYIQKLIRELCSVEIELISGEDEALLCFEGFKAEIPDITEGLIVDMGGGSTEILKFSNRIPERLNSFKFGCLSLRRDHVSGRFPTDAEKNDIKTHVRSELCGFDWIINSDRVCLIGGTGTAIGKLAVELGYTNTPELSTEEFLDLFSYLEAPDENRIQLLEKYIPSRVETILPGMCAYKTIIEISKAKSVYISSGGIRSGYIFRKINEE